MDNETDVCLALPVLWPLCIPAASSVVPILLTPILHVSTEGKASIVEWTREELRWHYLKASRNKVHVESIGQCGKMGQHWALTQETATHFLLPNHQLCLGHNCSRTKCFSNLNKLLILIQAMTFSSTYKSFFGRRPQKVSVGIVFLQIFCISLQ